MKSKSTTSAVKSMAAKKRIAYSEAADAIKTKLDEIKQNHHTYKANAASLALFGHNPFPSVPAVPTQTKSPHLQARTSYQLRLF